MYRKTKSDKIGIRMLTIFTRSYKYLFSYSKIANLVFIKF